MRDQLLAQAVEELISCRLRAVQSVRPISVEQWRCSGDARRWESSFQSVDVGLVRFAQRHSRCHVDCDRGRVAR